MHSSAAPINDSDDKKRRYFFSLTDGANSISDCNGIELCSDVDARDRAMLNAEDIVRRLNPTIFVTDVRGRTIYATSFEAALKESNGRTLRISNASWPEREAMLVQTEILSGVGGWALDLETRQLTWTDGTFSVFDLAVGTAPQYRASLRFFTANSRSALNRAIAKTIRDSERFDLELKIISASGISKWIRMVGQCERDSGVATRICGIVADISARTLSQQASWRLANQDSLTGLANRGLFQKQLATALKQAKREIKRVALVLLDLDNLKVVNDTQGHTAGDTLLKHVGALLGASIRDGDTAARIGGDEFALILNDIESDLDTVALAESIQARIRGTSSSPPNSRVSLGIAIFPDHDEDAEGLLKSADLALYAAKAAGRGALCLFSPEMRLNMLKKVIALESARNALRDGQFTAFYQPLVTLTSGAIAGFEALLRWVHPDKGILTPGVLQHALDDGELSAAIGVVVLDKVLGDVRSWMEQGFSFGRVGINVTPLELRQSHFARQFLERVQTYGVSATSLEIEVTENALVGRGSDLIEANLRQLSAAGVTIALDDFGTGYGSLIHLRQLPISTLKIDRAFVRDMKDAPHAKAIVRALITLARSLEMKLVAEGVETQEQADFLLHEGCTIAQGFLFNPALSSAQIVQILARAAPTHIAYQSMPPSVHELAK
jgi:diguanylate cyclase (GGDEF)-like protein